MKIFTKEKTPHSHSKRTSRQLWTERETSPLPYLHDMPTNQKIAFSRFSIVLTIVFWLMYITSVIIRQLIDGPKSYQFTVEVFSYVTVVSFLIFSALMYLISRQGALQRFSKHRRVPRAVLEKHFSSHQPSITVLIPSYGEETQVIRKTLLSAALQEYPDIRIVLLLDDDHKKIRPENVARFLATRALAEDIQELLSKPLSRFARILSSYNKKNTKNKYYSGNVIKKIADEYKWAADWLTEAAKKEVREDHVDDFFADQVLLSLAKDLNLTGEALIASEKEGARISREMVLQLYRRLVWIFGAKLDVFERKNYISLSHEANKAMNLNSYIGLMGGRYVRTQTPDGIVLVPASKPKPSDLIIPDSEFLLTLDADSILLKDYCLRLVYFLQQPDNADVAVTQTPYSSFRGASTRIERLSGATTDVQHILHQGMTYYNATFWVGANAVIRKRALEDIVEKEWVGGNEIKRYVQDRTVIEDTESSIDLALHGWRLVNYPERLSYSATPPDFGSLVVQRRRWANGGLLILPKLLSQVRERKSKGEQVSATEFMLRLNYMTSIAWSNLGLVFLLAYPYDGRLLSPLVLLASAPYFLSMASDLRYCRYSYLDIIQIYGFNLILLPVNIAGVLKSMQQALTTKKIPFARTPKIKNRTQAELMFVLSPIFIVGFSLFILWRNIEDQNWGNAAFAGFNAFAATWAIIAYIGLGNLIVDIWSGLTNMLYVEIHPKKQTNKSVADAAFDWQGILYHGEMSGAAPVNPTGAILLTNNNK